MLEFYIKNVFNSFQFQRYIAALTKADGVKKETFFTPIEVLEDKLETIEGMSSASIQYVRRHTNDRYEYAVYGVDLSISLAISLMQDTFTSTSVKDNDDVPVTPAQTRPRKFSSRLSTSIQASLKKTNQTGNYKKASDKVREAIAAVLLDEDEDDNMGEANPTERVDKDRAPSVILIDDDKERKTSIIVIDSDGDDPEDDAVSDNSRYDEEDVFIVEVPSNQSMWTPVNEPSVIHDKKETVKRKEPFCNTMNEIDNLTNAMDNLKTPTAVKLRPKEPKVQKISAVNRPLFFSSAKKPDTKVTDKNDSAAAHNGEGTVTENVRSRKVSLIPKAERKRKQQPDTDIQVELTGGDTKTKYGLSLIKTSYSSNECSSDSLDGGGFSKSKNSDKKKKKKKKKDKKEKKESRKVDKKKKERMEQPERQKDDADKITEKSPDECRPYPFYGTACVKDVSEIITTFSSKQISNVEPVTTIPATDTRIVDATHSTVLNSGVIQQQNEIIQQQPNVIQQPVHVYETPLTKNPLSTRKLRYIVIDGSNVAMR